VIETMTDVNLIQQIAKELKLEPSRVAGAVRLLDEGNTIPFIARYRKEATGVLDEEQLRDVAARLEYLRALDERKQTVLASIDEQGKLTDELAASIREASTLQQVEDLYLPYRPKRRTRATIARELGLEPLAEAILTQTLDRHPQELARQFLTEDVPDVESALAGARDIVAEMMAESATIRQPAREMTARAGTLTTQLASDDADPEGKYQLYYDFSAPLSKLQPHQILAINRGEAEKVLKTGVQAPDEAILRLAEQAMGRDPRSPFADELRSAIADGYKRLLAPAIERDLRRSLTEQADDHAIATFRQNLRNLLLQPPLKGRVVMGIDPGFRTGCKVAVCDPTGKVLDTATIYPHPPQNRRAEALSIMEALARRRQVQAIAIGNGTASRETEQVVADLVQALAEKGISVAYAIVNEAGASVYSASPLARAELPGLDVSMRGAVSIARRLQDPLAELVKIDPKSIGVGLYQHDVDQKKLTHALDAVVESVVNAVGVDVNTASPALLQHVAGLSKRVAENIVAYRDEHGPFQRRQDLLAVKGLGPKAFQQAAGFLRIVDGENPLDNTGIHPESYPIVELLMARHQNPDGLPLAELRKSIDRLAKELSVGVPTLTDILDALARPGRDPRDDLPVPILRTDVLSMDDLQEGMVLKGTVRNVVAFGAFVDIGVKQDGLVHISQMADRYVSDPHAVVRVGDVVDVRVMNVDKERGRIGLSMKAV
jgi:uncharacterized protein